MFIVSSYTVTSRHTLDPPQCEDALNIPQQDTQPILQLARPVCHSSGLIRHVQLSNYLLSLSTKVLIQTKTWSGLHLDKDVYIFLTLGKKIIRKGNNF